ncbi:hypothetical protein [Caballeronia glebae]|uniref:hypothetical protein n=1 Tax=Caballeronia glebae TaxID=1777143 RepID=UPI0038B7E862
MSRKTEVLSIKTTSTIKTALKVIAEREHRSVANTVETLVLDYFERHRLSLPGKADELPRQQQS